MKTANNMMILLLSIILVTGCAKKRPDRASVFSGLRNGETVKIDSLDNKWLSFNAESFQSSGENFGAENVEIAADVDFINDLPFVNFNTESTLLGDDLRIKAKVGADYQIWQKLDGKFLKVYLVGKKLDIPFEAWTYSKTLEDGRLAMPLVGYPVTYVRLLNAENSQGKETSFVSEDSLLKPEDFHKATHISPAWSSRQLFTSVDKKNVLPMSLFFDKETGEAESWMFSGYNEISGYNGGKSWITGGLNRSVFMGARNARFGFIPEVEMVKRSDALFFKSDFGATHSFVEKSSAEYQELDENYIAKLPVIGYSSYRVVTDVAGETLAEEAVNTNSSSYDSAEYVSLDFLKFETYSVIEPGSVFEKLIIEKDMISWVLNAESKKYRFNIWKKESSTKVWGETIAPRHSFSSDKAYFSLITSDRDYELDDAAQRYILNNDVDGNISRYAHSAKIEIRPTGALGSEPWVEDVLQRSVSVYNKLYKKAYEGYEVDEFGNAVEAPQFSYNVEPVSFGDPRYLKLNFSSLLYSGSGGWSSAFTEPKSGQIVGGSNYIVAAADLGYQELFVLAYVDGVLGKGSGTVLINPNVRGQFVEIPNNNTSNQLSGDPDAFRANDLEIGLIDHRFNYVLSNMGNMDFDTSERGENSLDVNSPSFRSSQVGVMPLIRNNSISNGGYGFNYDSEFLSKYGYSSSEDLSNTGFNDFYSNALVVSQENNSSVNSVLQGTLDDLAYAEMNNPYREFSPERHKLITSLCEPLSVKLNAVRASLDSDNIASMSSLSVYENLKEDIKSCATKLAVERIVATAVHEMLHGSGLSHNMHGSSDEDNYISEEFIKDVYGLDIEDIPGQVFWKTSSIMDYGNSAVAQTYLPGPYDLAAIRFIQTGRFENTDGGMTSVISGAMDEEGNQIVVAQSMNEAVSASQTGRKIYEVCGDQDIVFGRSVLAGGIRLNEDPMCDFSDSGATPVEKAQNIISDIKYRKAVATLTRDTSAWNQRSFDFRMQSSISRLREIYSFWRVLLARQVGSPENAYLEEFETASEYADFLKAIANNGSAQQKKLFQEYYQARNLVFNFLLDEAFSLNHYCVVDYTPVNKADGAALVREPIKDVVEFSKIKQLIQLSVDDEDDVYVGGCLDQKAQAAIGTYITSKRAFMLNPATQAYQVNSIVEVGNPLQGYRYSHKVLRSNSGLDAVGFSNYRASAFAAVTQRLITSFEDRTSGLYPNMIDEADLRLIVRARLEDRVNNGVRLNSKGAFGAGLVDPINKNEDQDSVQGIQTALQETSSEIRSLLALGGYEDINNALQSYDPMFISMLVPKMKEIAVDGCYNSSNASIIYGGDLNPAYLRFSEEDNLIGFYAAMYRNAITVPTDRDASLKRAEQFRVELISSYQKDYYTRNNSSIKFMDLGNYFAYPYQGATFVEQTIAKFDAINATQNSEIVNPEKVYNLLRDYGRELFTVHSSYEVTSPAYTSQTVAEFSEKLNGLFEEMNAAHARFVQEADPEEGLQLNGSELQMVSQLVSQKVGGFGNTPIVSVDLDGDPNTAETPISFFRASGLINGVKNQINQIGELTEYSTDSTVEARALMIAVLEKVTVALEEYKLLTMGEALEKEATYNRGNLLEANEVAICALPQNLRGNLDLINLVSSNREVYRAKVFTYEDLQEAVVQTARAHNITVLTARSDKEEADAQKNMLRNIIASFLRLQRF